MEIQKDSCTKIMLVDIIIRILENSIVMGIMEINMQVKLIPSSHLIVLMANFLEEMHVNLIQLAMEVTKRLIMHY